MSDNETENSTPSPPNFPNLMPAVKLTGQNSYHYLSSKLQAQHVSVAVLRREFPTLLQKFKDHSENDIALDEIIDSVEGIRREAAELRRAEKCGTKLMDLRQALRNERDA
jgi:hypothetical protein